MGAPLMIATVTMVLPDGKNRWYLEATRRDGEKVALHVNLAPGQRVPEIGDELLMPSGEEEEE
jgi:hypothetical protein